MICLSCIIITDIAILDEESVKHGNIPMVYSEHKAAYQVFVNIFKFQELQFSIVGQYALLVSPHIYFWRFSYFAGVTPNMVTIYNIWIYERVVETD